MPADLTTAEKTRRRILRAALTEDDFVAAVRQATLAALEEAKTLGWPESTQLGLLASFCKVGADMFAELTAGAEFTT
jgi:hypothetical protein